MLSEGRLIFDGSLAELVGSQDAVRPGVPGVRLCALQLDNNIQWTSGL